VALRFERLRFVVLLATIGLNVYLFHSRYTQGYSLPQQDNRTDSGSITADQDNLVPSHGQDYAGRWINYCRRRPGRRHRERVYGGQASYNTARLFISLKPLAQRKIFGRPHHRAAAAKLAKVPGATMYLQAAQDLRRRRPQSNAQYQFTMHGDNLDDLTRFAPRIVEQFKAIPIVADVKGSDQAKPRLASHDFSTHRGTAALSASRRNSSTTRSTTHSASAPYPPCIPR